MCLVDDKTRKSWSKFRNTKGDLAKIVEEYFEYLKGMGHAVKYLRCDNAGEHQAKLQKVCEKFGVQLEYTAPYTPQMNGVVERRIAVLLGGARAIMFSANLADDAKKKLWAEAVSYMETTRNSMSTTKNKESANKLFYGKHPSFLSNMVEFGRVGYVTKRDKMKGKIEDRAIKCVMVGYGRNHSGDTYRLYNPATKRILLSRDVTWSDWKMTDPTKDMNIFAQYDSTVKVPGIDELVVDIKKDDGFDKNKVYSISETTAKYDKNDNKNVDQNERKVVKFEDLPKKATKLERELRKLDTSYNRTESTVPKIHGEKSEVEVESGIVREGNVIVTGTVDPLPISVEDADVSHELMVKIHNTAVTSDVGDPISFSEALNSRRGALWRLSMIAEINNFLYRDAWIPTKLAKVRAKGRKPIPVKWVFKTKLEPDGCERLKSRIVSKSFMQVPGVDFTEKFSPVATDTSTRIIIGLVLYYFYLEWVCEAFDVEAAFLEPYMDIEMYVQWPDGIVELGFLTEEERDSTCAQLRRSMCGNVDAALRWLRDFTNFLVNECGFKACRTDPCILYLRENGILKIVMTIHVDDSLCAGNKKDLQKLYEKIRTKYNITTLGEITKYLGVRYDWKTDEKGERYVVASMKRNAEEIISYYEKVTGTKAKIAKTPGSQNSVLEKNEEEVVMLDEYRSLVGKLLFYVVKVAPDCANAVRDLARQMSNPGILHWKAMKRVVGYLLGKKLHGLVMRKPENLIPINYCDASYAKKSVSGMIGTIGGMMTSWSSRTIKTTTLSSTESEYVALSECGQELKFVGMLLEEIGISKSPGIIYEDNEGAIFLAKNQQVGMRTKYIDVRYHFIRDLIRDKFLDLRYVESENNYADIMTKNVSNDVHERLYVRGLQNGYLLIVRYAYRRI